jgi:D-inositol-3-phosphate glycosyltransferase
MQIAKKNKILFVSTDVRQCVGYSRVAYRMLNHLAEDANNEIYHFAFSNFKHIQLPNRQLNENIKVIDVLEEEEKIGSSELYGVDIIERFMNEIKPDVLFIYNDIVVISRIFNALLEYKKTNTYYKTVVYLDLVYDYERFDMVQHVDRNTDMIFVFTQHWKDNLVSMKVNKDKIKVMPHGINTEQITLVSKQEARFKLGLNQEDFIFLNTNRNSYRKSLDITISAFLRLLKKHSLAADLKLFLNCRFDNIQGYMIFDYIKIECIRLNIDYDKVITTNFIALEKCPSGLLTDEVVNLLYNACDVGLNTCIGEGFGLCNMEHAAVGAPQIVTNVGGLKEIFKNGHSKLVNPVVDF